MALKPQKTDRYDCLSLNNKIHGGAGSITEEVEDSFEDNYGFKYVYINFDYDKPYKAIVYEGTFKSKEVPYKYMQFYPYDVQVFEVGQYISFYDTYGNENVMLLEALDMQERDAIIGHAYKCNNMLKWYDGYGVLREYPCVYTLDNNKGELDWNMSVDVVIGSARLLVQCNEYTKLINDNQRFIFNGKAMVATDVNKHYQNDTFDVDSGGVITLGMMRDTIASDDDLINCIANTNKYNYEIVTIPQDLNCVVGSNGVVSSEVFLNNMTVDEEVIWTSSDEAVLTVDSYGNYAAISSGSAKVSCTMKNNENIVAEINVEVSQSSINDVEIIVEPSVKKILQGRTQEFICAKYVDGLNSNEVLLIEDVSGLDNDCYEIVIEENRFTITNIKKSDDKVIVHVRDIDGNKIILEYTLGGLW